MDLDTIMNLITNTGFPIVCVICLWQYAQKTSTQIIELTRQVTDALVRSTNAIDEIKDVLSKIIEK